MKRVLFVGALASALLSLQAPAFASTPEIGPCNEPGSIVVRVGQTAKVCILLPPVEH